MNNNAPTPTNGPAERLNEKWWHEYGGQVWLEEIAKRRETQHRYGEQEAFLIGLFAGMPPVRVLDFGCGFGRHIRNLVKNPKIEIHGCDISPKMVAAARAYVSEDNLAADRISQIPARGALPFPTGFFDVVYTSEVLVHVDIADLPAILSELWRVSRGIVVHIENVLVSASRFSNLAHDGCWLHDFRGLYKNMFGVEVATHTGLIDQQAVYVARKPDSLVGTSPGLLDESVTRYERLLRSREEEIAKLHLQKERLVTANSAASPVRERRSSGLLPSLSRVWRRTGAASEIELAPSLPFGGFAARSSSPTIEHFAQARPDIVAICHPDWRGIRAATYGQTEHILEIPGFHDDLHVRATIEFLRACGTRKVIINGFPPNSDRFLLALRDAKPKMEGYVVYHGGPAQNEDAVVKSILEMADAAAVARIGFVKNGLAEVFASMGYEVAQLGNILRMPMNPARTWADPRGSLHLGVFMPNVFHKNLANQVLAALMVPSTIVHLCEQPDLPYLERFSDRMVVHGMMPHDTFLPLLNNMHGTFYASFVECYPMTVLESLASGAVCITSHTSMLFDDSPHLFEHLVVTNHDNPTALARKMTRALELRQDLVPRAQAHILALNELALQRWKAFLS